MIINFDKNTTTAAGGGANVRRHQEPAAVTSCSSSSSSSSTRRGALSPGATRSTRRQSNSSCCSGQFGEVAGGTAAECAAICCCCPCGLVNLLILTVYKVPAGLCHRVLRRKRRERVVKKGLLPPRARKCQCGCDGTEIQMHPVSKHGMPVKVNDDDNDNDNDNEMPQRFDVKEATMKLEKEMWETFYGTGFWRSPSQREQSDSAIPNTVSRA